MNTSVPRFADLKNGNFEAFKPEASFLNTLEVNETDRNIIRQFAIDNQFNYNDIVHKISGEVGVPGQAWIAGGQAAFLLHTVTGVIHNYGFSMATVYKWSGVSKSNSSTTKYHTWKLGVVRVKLNKIFPQMVLDSHKNESSILSSVHVSPKNDQRISLEGHFNSYFDFYAPKNLQINALTVLAPNFMQIIMESSATFDVEFCGDEMILTTSDPIFTAKVMQAVDKALEAQLSYMRRLEESWNYTPLKQPYDLLRLNAISGQNIKVGNMRFPTGAVLLIGFLLIFGFFILLSLAQNNQ